jgi:uncharacterized protein YndB with AHSA1/START domain
MVQIHEQRTIAASPERVFDWLLNPANFTVSPLLRKGFWAKGSGPDVGAIREVTTFGGWVHEQITAYDPPRSYAYLVVESSPPSEPVAGTLICTPSGDGTHIDWVTACKVPARRGGKVSEMLTARLISFNLRKMLAGCAKALET